MPIELAAKVIRDRIIPFGSYHTFAKCPWHGKKKFRFLQETWILANRVVSLIGASLESFHLQSDRPVRLAHS